MAQDCRTSGGIHHHVDIGTCLFVLVRSADTDDARSVVIAGPAAAQPESIMTEMLVSPLRFMIVDVFRCFNALQYHVPHGGDGSSGDPASACAGGRPGTAQPSLPGGAAAVQPDGCPCCRAPDSASANGVPRTTAERGQRSTTSRRVRPRAADRPQEPDGDERLQHQRGGARHARHGGSQDLLSGGGAVYEAERLRTLDPVAATAQGHGEAATADSGLQIAVMIRSDVFRNVRARRINATPGPADFFRVVNSVVAQHLAEIPARLLGLTAALAEASRADLVNGGLAD